MKKTLKILLAILCMLAVFVSFTACNMVKSFFGMETEEEEYEYDSKDSSLDEEESDSNSFTQDQDVSIPTVSSAEEQVADYVSENREDALSALNNDSSFIMDLVAEGTIIYYEYTYTDPNVRGQAVSDALEEAMSQELDTLETALTAIQIECPAVTGIGYKYYTSDGQLLYQDVVY